jgi:putative hydrolase of the HAD superfamily
MHDGAPVRAVVFDMGGIIHPTPFEVLGDVERERGLAPGTLPRGPFAPEGDPDYDALDRGELRQSAYWARQQRHFAARGLDLDVHRIIDWTGRDRPEVVAAIRALAARYRLALLTNDASEWLGPRWRDDWYLRDSFEVVVDAADEGVRKPAARIYLRVAEALRLPPAGCLFVDDLQVNVEGASRAGMRAVHFDVRDARRSTARLLALLGLEAGEVLAGLGERKASA